MNWFFWRKKQKESEIPVNEIIAYVSELFSGVKPEIASLLVMPISFYCVERIIKLDSEREKKEQKKTSWFVKLINKIKCLR